MTIATESDQKLEERERSADTETTEDANDELLQVSCWGKEGKPDEPNESIEHVILIMFAVPDLVPDCGHHHLDPAVRVFVPALGRHLELW